MARISKYEQIEHSLATKWNAGLYIRLSREDGDKLESESVSSQKAILEHFLNEHTDINVHDSYVDDGWSGTDFERPAFKRLFKDITDKKVNCVIVKDLSRFGRNYIESGKYLETVFPLLKVRFIAINDMVDSIENPTSVNSVMLPFKNIMNDEYCRDISAKVRSSLTARRFQGKFIGSSPSYGYKKHPDDHNKLIIDEEPAAVVRRIYEMFLAGNSILGITRYLNNAGIENPSTYKKNHGANGNRASASTLWIDTTVRRILSNRMYVGDMVQKKYEVVSYKIHVGKPTNKNDWIIVKNTHEPIISREDFDRVQSLLERDTRVCKDGRKLSKFAGFIKCADCGRAMNKKTITQPYKKYDYYVCSTFRRLDKGGCTKHTIRSDVLEKSVLTALNKYIAIAVDYEELKRQIKNFDLTDSNKKNLKTAISEKQQEIQKLGERLLCLYPDYKDGILSREQYLALKEKYEAEISRCKNAIAEFEKNLAQSSEHEDTEEIIKTLKKYNGLKELTREAVVELFENIFIREGGEVEVHLKCKDALALIKKFNAIVETNVN